MHRACAVLTPAIEIGAPLALLGGRVARVWVWGVFLALVDARWLAA